jgi:YqaJ-like viral recombinase domain
MSSDGHMTDFDRFGRITASVVPAITRTDPTKSRKWAWRVITGREPVRTPGPDAARGLEHEEDAIAAAEAQLVVLAMPGRFVAHRNILWLGASPDGFIVETLDGIEYEIPVEAKCPRVLHVEIPPWYYDQVQTQLECCDAPYAYFVSWTQEFHKIIKIARDKDWWEKTYPMLKDFYEQYIVPDIEPPQSPRRGKKPTRKELMQQQAEMVKPE